MCLCAPACISVSVSLCVPGFGGWHFYPPQNQQTTKQANPAPNPGTGHPQTKPTEPPATSGRAPDVRRGSAGHGLHWAAGRGGLEGEKTRPVSSPFFWRLRWFLAGFCRSVFCLLCLFCLFLSVLFVLFCRFACSGGVRSVVWFCRLFVFCWLAVCSW